MFDFSIMSQEDYPFSDLDFLLSKDNITEDDLLQIPEVPPEEPKTPCNHTSITHELESLSLTPTDKPTIAVNIRPRKRKSTTPSRQLFHKQKKAKKPLPNILLPKTLSSNLIWPTKLKKIKISGE